MLRNILSVPFVFLAAGLMSACGEKPVSYSQDVYPILEKNCLSCHVRGERGYEASGLSMESYEDLMKGTKYGPVITPGSGFSSTIAILIEHKGDPKINMPHKQQPLPEKDIETIKNWIDQGAKNN
jgi:hypothetical protein